MTMKVLYVTEQNIMGGGEWNLLFLIGEMLEYNIEIGILSCNDELLNLLPDRVKKFNCKGITKRGWLSYIPLIWRQIDLSKTTGQSWDIIHFYSPNPTCRMLFNRSKKVWTVHGAWEHASGFRGAQLQLIIDKFLPVSEDVNRTCSVPVNKVKCIELGIKPSNYMKNINEKEAEHKAQFNFLCLGRYQSVKGQDILLNALGSLKAKMPKGIYINLHLYGEVDDSRKEDIIFYKKLLSIKERFEDCEYINVRINGANKDIESLYNWADVCVIPSRYESFSMVAAESLTFGLPIIVSDNGAPHTFIKGKNSGLIFRNNNVESLASCLFDFIGSYNSFDDFVDYRERFSISRQALEVLDVYNSVME